MIAQGSPTSEVALDPITLSVIQGALGSIVDEMDLRLMRAAISPIVSESKDMADGIFTPDTGEMVAQGAEGLPVFLAQMQFTVRLCIEKAEAQGGFREGDIWITNDVYRGGTHLNDIQLVTPFFYDGKLEFLLASTAHWQDIGGSTPGGWTPHATDIHEEGVQVPPLLLRREGELNDGVLDMLLENVRLKADLRGDMAAMLAALNAGRERLTRLFDRRGADLIQACVTELSDRAEIAARKVIADIPDGRYEFTDWLDNDGVEPAPVKITVAVEVAGDTMHLDFTGTDPATVGPTGISATTTIASCHIAIRHLFPSLPVSGGAFRPYRFTIPPGSCLAVEYPKPVSGYLEVVGRVIETVNGALAQAIPEDATAACFGTSAILTVAGNNESTGRFFAVTYIYPGGYGGGRRGDGLVHGPTPQSMARALGLEMCERRFPIIHDYWQLRPDSGGPGKFRGGCGTQYRFRVTQSGCQVTVLGDRMDHRPYGIAGGGEGAPNELRFTLDGKDWQPPMRSKASRIKLERGDAVHMASPGGGGYGPPEERDPSLIERDIALGYLTPEAAARDYRREGARKR